MKYQRLRDLQRTMLNLVDNREELVRALFEEIPDLVSFTWIKTQEYDDNNYFDNIQVRSINGHRVGWNGYEDEDEENNLPKIPQTHMVEDLIGAISDRYEFREEEIEFLRDDYEGPVRKSPEKEYERDKKQYFLAMLSRVRLPDGFFAGKDPILAVYHALDYGRIGNEMDVFARRGEMMTALEYARVVGGRLAPDVENFYILDNHEDDREHLKTYLGEFCKK